ncbi:hypothetical protein ASG90_18935 [Nocardioides sp. Soil797]|nr:hypothetical protein ASG90_18935 [Nocardioides sp. Soil797]
MNGSGLVTRGLRRHELVADAVLALLLAVVLGSVTTRTVLASSWSHDLRLTVIGALAIGHLAVATRRLLPVPSFAVECALALLLVLTPPLDAAGVEPFSAVLAPSVLVFPVVLYSVAAWSDARTSWLAIAVSLLGAVIAVARMWGADYLTVAQPGLSSASHPTDSWLLFLSLSVLATVVGPWLLGRYRRLRLLYVEELEQRALREEADREAAARVAAEQERHRIAREMHDVVAHSLAVMVSQAEGGRMVSAQDPDRAAAVLGTISGVGRDAMRDMRGILAVLHDADVATSPQPTLADLPALVDSVERTGLAIRLDERGPRRPLCPTGDLATYRFLQEALTNVLKHAGTSTPVTVDLQWRDDAVEVVVHNRIDGPTRTHAGAGRGLAGMSERIAALGGTLQVEAGRRDFRVTATVPVDDGSDR